MKWQIQVVLISVVICASLFLPTTIILFFAMLPTIVAALIDRTGTGTKALTVGAMNLAGTVPFIIDLWTRGHSLELSLKIISDPKTIIVIYSAAAVGYLIDWALSGMVANMILNKLQNRKQAIIEEQGELIKRWGREVTGELPLDAYGFPVENPEDAEKSLTDDVEETPVKPTEKAAE